MLGILALGLGIATMVQAQIGLGPWGVLHQGISFITGISLGTVTILVGLVVMLLWIPLGERLGPGTIINTFTVGVLINIFMELIPVLSPELLAQPWLFAAQVGQMALGVTITGIGAGLYLGAGLGAGPRDGVMMGLVRHTGHSVRLIRTLLELTALLTGWLLGGTVGLGTLMFAFGVGPIVQTTMQRLEQWHEIIQRRAQFCAGDSEL